MIRHVSICSSVYGGRDGAVAFLDSPEGVIPPPHIAHMVYLGPPCDVVTMAVNYLLDRQRAEIAAAKAADEAHPHRPRPQQALADLLGSRQQYISRWINAEAAPELTSEQWARLIRLAIAAHERIA